MDIFSNEIFCPVAAALGFFFFFYSKPKKKPLPWRTIPHLLGGLTSIPKYWRVIWRVSEALGIRMVGN